MQRGGIDFTSSEPMPAVIGGRYRVVRPLAMGGMGAVYGVQHATTGERLALKVMGTGGDGDPQLLTRFRREASAAAMIASEHVVRIIEIDAAPELDGRLFLVMELLSGADLGKVLETRGPLPPAESLEYLVQVARGLEQVHAAGIVHRDLKPPNLFVHTTAEGGRIVKLLDFGVARLLDPDATTVTDAGGPVGTPRFMAPEQFVAGMPGLGPTTDVWAFGLTALELLTGEGYWRSNLPSAVIDEIRGGPRELPTARWRFLPPRLDGWFLRSCATEPRDRWRSIREQIDALVPILERAAALRRS
jgi:serine/threonine-protein kinase